MTVYTNVLTAIVPLFALILFGYFARKMRLLHATDAPVLNRFVISISLPAFVFHALLTHRLRPDLLALPLVFWIAEFAVMCLAVGAGKLFRWPGTAIGTLLLQSVFGNTGYIGYPMCSALLPARLPAAVIIDQMGMSIPLYPGAPVIGGIFGRTHAERKTSSALAALKTPAFLALVFGLLLKLVPAAWVPTSAPLVLIGHYIMQIIGLIGGVTIPVVLIAVGLLLRPSSLPQHSGKVLVIGLFKLALMPVMVWLVGRFLFQISGSLLSVCVMEAAMPPSATSTVFAGLYDLDGSLAIAAFFAATVVSAFTLPLMLGLLH